MDQHDTVPLIPDKIAEYLLLTHKVLYLVQIFYLYGAREARRDLKNTQ